FETLTLRGGVGSEADSGGGGGVNVDSGDVDAEVVGINGGNRLECVSGSVVGGQKYMRTGLISTMPKKQQLQQLQQQQQHLGIGGTMLATTKPKYSLTLLNVKNHQHNNNNSSNINNNNNSGSMGSGGVGNCQLHPHRKSPHPHLQPQYAYYQQQQQQQQQQQLLQHQHLPQSKREQQRQQLSQSYYHPPPPPRHQLRVLRLSSAPTGTPELTTTKATANGAARRGDGGDRSSGEYTPRNSAHIEPTLALTPTTPTTATTPNTNDCNKHLVGTNTVECDDNSSSDASATPLREVAAGAATATKINTTATRATTQIAETPTASPMSNVLHGKEQQQQQILQLQQQKANRLWYH
ncbi:ras-interacting protein RIP3-like, partial [Zeugodacus cucurbitae]|uniref:ras-interacting protein RIP3-like n=1 Tax=Zeugodacus cucurbitae TaxID=28588 RepID=UPI0023D93663